MTYSTLYTKKKKKKHLIRIYDINKILEKFKSRISLLILV